MLPTFATGVDLAAGLTLAVAFGGVTFFSGEHDRFDRLHRLSVWVNGAQWLLLAVALGMVALGMVLL
jgi:hypothetical protein